MHETPDRCWIVRIMDYLMVPTLSSDLTGTFFLLLHTFTWCHGCHNWSFHSLTSQMVDNPMLYKAIISLWFLPLSSLIIISSSCGVITVLCFLLPAQSCSLISVPFTAITTVQINSNTCQIQHNANTINSQSCYWVCQPSGVIHSYFLMPPDCGTIPTYWNLLKYTTWTKSLC